MRTVFVTLIDIREGMMHASPLFPDKEATLQPGLHFCLLGPPTITWNGEPLAIPRRSVRALLYRLACDSEPVSRGHLHLLFWPDVPESVARRNLSHHLTHLRRALPLPFILVASHDQVELEPSLVWCDVVELKRASSSSTRDISLFHHLASLYRGPLLDGFDLPGCPEFEHWCILERNALERQYLKVLESLVEVCSLRGETGQAVKYAQQYLETDPLSEVIHQQLIQLYAAAGDRHLALQQFERCSSTLEAELGVVPLPETRSIYQAVLTGQRRFPEPPAPLRPPGLPDTQVPILGREDELYQLEAAFLKLHARQCPPQNQVVLISGEAGIGKSRLMQEFAHRHQGEARLLYGSGHAGEQAIPYQPILNILRTILCLPEIGSRGQNFEFRTERPPLDFVEQVWLSEISRLLPEMRSVYPDLPAPLPVEPESARSRLFDALCHLISAFATVRGPLLLCLDDLQWMDATTRAWLVHNGRFLERDGYPILILCTYRSEEAEAILDLRRTLARAGVLVELKLSGLGEAAVLQLQRHLIGQRAGDEMLAGRLHQATGGNPFFIIETLHKLVEEGRLEQHFQGSLQFTLPESIQEALQARLQRLNPIARQVLEAGAVLGQSFGIDLLRLTAGRSHVEIMIALEELVARILLVEAPQEYRFINELTRQHVEESLGQVRRQLLHLRAGRAHLRLDPEAFTILAHHFEWGGDLRKALLYHEQAAKRAHVLFAWQVVEFHYGRMLELLAHLDPGYNQTQLVHQRGDIFAERAHIRYLLGRQAERDADLEALSNLGRASNDDQVRLQAVLNRLRYLNLDGEYARAIVVAEKGLALLSSSQVLSMNTEQAGMARSRLLAQTGFAFYFLGKPLEALSVLEEAWSLCEHQTDPEACGRILHILGYVYFHLGQYHGALQCQQQAYAYHQQAGDYNRMAWDLMDIGALHKNLGDMAKALEFLEQGLELSRRVGSQQAKTYGLAHLGSLDLYQGDYAAAAAHYQQILELQPAIHSEHVTSTAEAGVGLALYHLGDYAHSRRWMERALQRARASGHRRRMAETLIQIGLVDLAQGCLAEARQRLDDGLEIAGDCQSGECMAAGLAAKARLERLAGHPICAREQAAEAVSAAVQIGQAGCEMWGEIEAGLACLALEDLSSALEHTRRAASLAPHASQDWIGCEEAYLAHARVLRAFGQGEAAANQEHCAQNTLLAKAELIPDPLQRRRFLAKSNLD